MQQDRAAACGCCRLQGPTFVPAVRVTSVLPTLRTVNAPGALMSYQSFFEKGSTLQQAKPAFRWPVP